MTETLVVTSLMRRRIAQLTRAAEAAPLPLGDTLARLQRQRAGDFAGDAPQHMVMLGGGFVASCAVEEWPDGRWRRLSLSHPRERPGIPVLVGLLDLFGFSATLAEKLLWRSREGSRGWTFHVAELIAAAPSAAPAAEAVLDEPAPMADPDDGGDEPDDDA